MDKLLLKSIRSRKKQENINFEKKSFNTVFLFVFFFVILIVLLFTYYYFSKNITVKVHAEDISSTKMKLHVYDLLAENNIEIKQSTLLSIPVTVQTQSTTTRNIVHSSKVSEILDELNIEIESIKTIPSLNSYVTFPYNIQIIQLREEIVSSTEELNFNTTYIDSNLLEIGTQNVLQEGSPGIITNVYKNYYEDDELVSHILLSREITTQPINKIVENGTLVVPKTITINGDTFTYCYKYNVYATYYDRFSAGGTITSTGRQLEKGVVAVDPSVFPYYTQMYIPGYGYGQALDTGGGVKGMHIDLGFYDYSQDPYGWYTGNTDIYILCQ